MALALSRIARRTVGSKKKCCKGRIRTYTRQLAGKQGARAGGQPQSTFRLSRYPHPRDKRVCLPVSSPHNVVIGY